jgi:hypothetical protein
MMANHIAFSARRISMKRGKALLFLLCSLLLAGTTSAAWARHGHFRHGHARVGIYLGIPLTGPYYYPPHYYYPSPYYSYAPSPVIVTPAAPPVYIEQTAPQASTQLPSNYWYYCNDPQGYYPYVKDCPAGWQKVAPQPSSRQ